MRPSDDMVVVEDRRALTRVATALRGKAFPGEIDCVLKDYNERGARLRFSERPPAVERFVVVIWSSGLAFEAAARWRAGLEVGVQFLHARDFRRRVPAHLAAIRAVWQKRQRKLGRRELMACPAMIQKRPPMRPGPPLRGSYPQRAR